MWRNTGYCISCLKFLRAGTSLSGSWLRGPYRRCIVFVGRYGLLWLSIPGTSGGGSGCVDVLDSVCMHDEQCLQNFASEYSLRFVLVAPEDRLAAVE